MIERYRKEIEDLKARLAEKEREVMDVGGRRGSIGIKRRLSTREVLFHPVLPFFRAKGCVDTANGRTQGDAKPESPYSAAHEAHFDELDGGIQR